MCVGSVSVSVSVSVCLCVLVLLVCEPSVQVQIRFRYSVMHSMPPPIEYSLAAAKHIVEKDDLLLRRVHHDVSCVCARWAHLVRAQECV